MIKNSSTPYSIPGYTECNDDFIDGLAESQRDAVIAIKANGRISYINNSAASLLNVPLSTVEDIEASRLFTLTSETDAARQDPALKVCLTSSEITDLGIDCVLLMRDGAKIPVAGVVVPWRNHKGQQIGVMLTLRRVSSARALYSRLARV